MYSKFDLEKAARQMPWWKELTVSYSVCKLTQIISRSHIQSI